MLSRENQRNLMKKIHALDMVQINLLLLLKIQNLLVQKHKTSINVILDNLEPFIG